MKIYERQPADEVRALARLTLVDESELLEKAQLVQEGLTNLDEMGFHTYYYLMGILSCRQKKAETLPFEPDEDDEDEDDDDVTDEERYADGLWADREDTAESRAIERAIEMGEW